MLFFILDVLGTVLTVLLSFVVIMAFSETGDARILLSIPLLAFLFWLHFMGIKKFKETT